MRPISLRLLAGRGGHFPRGRACRRRHTTVWVKEAFVTTTGTEAFLGLVLPRRARRVTEAEGKRFHVLDRREA